MLPPFLMMPRNSSNSITPDWSSSTRSTMFWICWRLSTRPRAMRGSSSSSTPILPEPSSSSESKYVLSYLSSSSSKSMQCSLPRDFSHFLSPDSDRNWKIKRSIKNQCWTYNFIIRIYLISLFFFLTLVFTAASWVRIFNILETVFGSLTQVFGFFLTLFKLG